MGIHAVAPTKRPGVEPGRFASERVRYCASSGIDFGSAGFGIATR